MNTWDEITQRLSKQIPRQGFETWLKPTQLFQENENEIMVSVPSKFSKEWIEKHYLDIIKDLLAAMDLKKTLIFSVNKKLTGSIDQEKEQNVNVQEIPVITFPQRQDYTSTKERSFLNPRFTFENFVVGPSNQFAHAAARAVAEVLYKAYNPLFIYGGVGLGKTHLMHAIGHHILAKNANIRVTFVSTEHFMNEMISCIRYDRMSQFRNKYRNMDVLMVDDIQFLSDKERTQEEFFHTFNALYDSRKQLVFSSDRYPKEIQNLEERLRSRFEWGLLADIHPPDLETKVAILRKKAEIERINLPNDVGLFLAKKIRSNVRELEGSLIKLGAFSSLSGQEVTIDLAKTVLKDFLNEKEDIVTIEKIQKKVSEHFNVRVADLRSKKRTQTIVLPRQVSMYLCRKLTDKSLPEIGKSFGGKDHTTVIHACRNIESKMKKKEDFAAMVQKLMEETQSQ
ncbi:MAG: chromosomal replication initiator protein DnaA [Nitrospirae bacterium CG_4_9_14_3_um_filter_53_35]|nr:MAG: chromosomal replication initiation protein DnaA [Nitrospirae bacterium CG2_30_53_67]PIS37543.1 MAG: chromosomal replication initiator protein DnaA [Nitrospirae bacterium CG08_land_8_20_14_0_20_52_24]PIW85647.1 MAG: chromosomal replication initiator protein DnaA [Nitrospirae bacterium CG_4_8_14_3_um_filter_50_41]PIX87047.1 MAG: chromosomal replication initiator protein DnaA [Nitrospirae bacterium CG_4_10_14_3_um_filter_53_41]PJA77479.1 MAG: chromosomal replication initiator protein DnaA 